jgi:xylulokinase
VPLVAGVDSSTQATKVELRDADSGELVATGRAPHPPVRPPVAEQDPAAWWSAFEAAFAEATTAAAAGDVAAISVAGQQHGCVVLDDAFEVIRPAKLWCDTTTAPDAAWLTSQLPAGDAGWAQAVGSALVASHTITKLSWLHRSEPETWARLAHVCLPHDWLTHRLTGGFTTDRGDASGTGYWSPSAERYRVDLLEIVDRDRDWGGALPDVLGPADPAGEWRGAVVGPGTGDNMAAALGIALGPGEVCVSIGSSGVVSVVAEAPTADPSGAVAGFADAAGRFLPIVCTLNAAKVTDAVAALLGVDAAGLDRLASAAPLGAGGLTLLPYLDGERTPNRPDATGTLAGIRTDVSRESLARAAVEGVVCGLLDGLDALGGHARLDGDRLWLVGGGARSAAYRQVLADLSGRVVTAATGSEAVAAGACVQAAAVLARRAPEDVADDWAAAGALGRAVEVAPSTGGDHAERAAEVRARYAGVRDAGT